MAAIQYPNAHISCLPFHFRVKIIRDKKRRGFMWINKILSYSQSNIQILSWQRNSWAWSVVEAWANCWMECKENPGLKLRSSQSTESQSSTIPGRQSACPRTTLPPAWEIQGLCDCARTLPPISAVQLLWWNGSVQCLSMKDHSESDL